ncbi:crotonase/enoyl-CoA hydratase family protein [Minwuia sp.]|uniref:crotonase/enoyl-CoA hydratase family protein n=1 Tax=Minwuia sp. TaxID=2493630 RepID=UPI003A8F5497
MAVVETEKREHVFIITLNRPEARNAINGDVAEGIEAAIDAFEADDDLWVGIIASSGKVFCAGADLKAISSGDAGRLSTKRGGFAGIVKRERTKPLIAAVNGAAVAGGCEIVLASDMVVAAEEAVFGVPEVKRSLVPAAGGLFRLPRAVGPAVGMELMLTGDPITAQRAHDLGLVNYVVAQADLMDKALELAGRITANAPLAVQRAMQITKRAMVDSDEELWKASTDAMRYLGGTEDFKEGPRAFIEKRAPVWKAK